MKTLKIISLAAWAALNISTNAFDEGRIERFQWENLEVVYIEDVRFPTYRVSFYFADGALSDGAVKGETQTAFDLLKSGTRRYSQRDIADNLEFFGVSTSANTNHEYSVYSFSGLAKDVVPTTKKICHLFVDATYPKVELDKHKKKVATGLQSLINNPAALANRAFRQIALQNSPYGHPVGGKMAHVRRLRRRALQSKLAYFNGQVKKRIYLSGPRQLLSIKDVILNECGWRGNASFVRPMPKVAKATTANKIVLVTIPKANQAQVRAGRWLRPGEFDHYELLSLSSKFLGGGFGSRLFQELRVKRGLTYGAYSSIGIQKGYGVAMMQTSTKNESVGEVLDVIQSTVQNVARGQFASNDLGRSKGNLAGGYPFQFERVSAFLGQLIFLDHTGRSFSEFQKYPERVKAIKSSAVAQSVKSIFEAGQTVVVLGSRELLKQLQSAGSGKKVRAIDYKKFL